jgi:hypothetical protein
MELDKKYVVVTVIGQFRIRYAIPMDELQALNPDMPVDPKWALDSVTCQEVEEFSQEHLGETIIDHAVLEEAEILKLFDTDNKYLSGWPTEQKLAHIRKWRSRV